MASILVGVRQTSAQNGGSVRVLLRRAATLIARLREQAWEGMPPGEGVAEAFRPAAPTNAAAGLILAGTFVSLTLAGNTILAQLGTSHITQRGDGIGMRTRRAAAPCAPETETKQECSTATFQGPVPLVDPGLARVPRPRIARDLLRPADISAIRDPSFNPGSIRASRPGSRSFPAPSSATSFLLGRQARPYARYDRRDASATAAGGYGR